MLRVENRRKSRDLRASETHRRRGGAFGGGCYSQSCGAGCSSIKAALLLESCQGKREEGGRRGSPALSGGRGGSEQGGRTAKGRDAVREVLDTKAFWTHEGKAGRGTGRPRCSGESRERLKAARHPQPRSAVFALTNSWGHELWMRPEAACTMLRSVQGCTGRAEYAL